jgi:hypothetical protein
VARSGPRRLLADCRSAQQSGSLSNVIGNDSLPVKTAHFRMPLHYTLLNAILVPQIRTYAQRDMQ